MESISRITFCITIWIALHAIEVKSETGFLYNAQMQRIDEVKEGDAKKHSPLYVVACPANSEQESKFNNFISVGKNSLFVRKVYTEDMKAIDLEVNICQKSFKHSVVFDKKKYTYEIGYELYYKENELDLECTRYDDLREIIENVPYLNELSISKNLGYKDVVTGKYSDEITTQVLKNIKFTLPDKQTLVFHWIPVLSIKFNPIKSQVRINLSGNVVIDRHTSEMNKSNDYLLGRNSFSFYPFLLSEDDSSKIGTPLMPLMFLHTKASRTAAFTHLNFIPVLRSVLDGHLRFIDEFLYTLYRHYSTRINLIFGITGARQKIKTSIRDDQNNLLTDESDENTILVPNKIIYRIVEYMMPTPPSSLNFYLVIIIHNDRNHVPGDERICPKNQVYDYALSNEDNPEAGISYACAPSWELFQKLGAFDSKPVRSTSTLYLSELNVGIGVNKIDKENVLKSVEKEMPELFGDRYAGLVLSGINRNVSA
ncbi:uncharacterized protein LOC135835534 [Planococcus citri]|uniref:uncharacterized protein LOC135835534 n=1 Tax=Planococcus citri TaxID=170843 RepID=UPI0031F88CCD